MPETTSSYQRPDAPQVDIDAVLDSMQSALYQKLDRTGQGAFVGKHEILGALEDEMFRLKKAINESHLGVKPLKNELLDMAVTCIVGLACIRAGIVTK